MKNKVIKNICCIGAGYVGGPTMSVIASKCPDLIVNVVDINEKRIDAWNSNDLNQLPVFEPGLEKIGVGAGFASDLKWIESSARQIAKFAKRHTVVVEKSTLPVKTAETIKLILNSRLKKNLQVRQVQIWDIPNIMG